MAPAGPEVDQILACYPRIYFACHERHRSDPETQTRLSAARAGVLDHLDTDAPVTLKDLARHMGVTAATMSIRIDRLARDGWVSKRRDRTDARRVNLLLTADGARMKEAARVLEPGRVGKLLARLSPDERADALRGLALLARAADQEIASWSHKRHGETP